MMTGKQVKAADNLPLDPRVIGGRYFSSYWRTEYTVTGMKVINGVQWFTCLWADGDTTVHCTAWNERDRIVEVQK